MAELQHARSKAAPGMCARDGDLYVAWSDHHELELHTLSSSDGGVNWPDNTKTSLGETSEHGPAICEFNGRLYIAWTGTHGGAHLNIRSSPDGSAFPPKVTLTDTASAFGPALTVFNNRLYLAWVSPNSQHILIRSSADGTAFPHETESKFDSPSIGPPALQVAHTSSSPSGDPGGPLLLLAWTDGEQRLRIAGSTDGLCFKGGETIGGETSFAGPALLTAQLDQSTTSMVYIAWTGTGERRTVNTMASDDPGKLSGGFDPITKHTFNNASSLAGPSLTGLFNHAQPKFFMSYTQADSHHLEVITWQPGP